MKIVCDQAECDAAFRKWADTLTEYSKYTGNRWIIEGTGVIFTNYGHGKPGEITREVMLGVDPVTRNSTVKIVRPNAAKVDKGPVTVLAEDESGRRYLLREGRLQKNNISKLIKTEFAHLSGLREVPLFVERRRSKRSWYVVADLASSPNEIVAQAASFSLACARARNLAGGGLHANDDTKEDQSRPTYGMDEKGRITKRSMPGGITEVCELQGYVYSALKSVIGKKLLKPSNNGYCVDGFIGSANLLIEIKTGTSAHYIYEGIGQLLLYPSLIGIKGTPELALVIPDDRPLRPVMAAALNAVNITVFTYKIDGSGKAPQIIFSKAFIDRCEVAAAAV
ncbi:hypothetical protein MKK64_13705 [Methylobacterium sp. E-025]|uniref:hypothetical protein n=1 Tax=Methylobacterium sp. E-025 TaxID=2836561 RepID=UPI001FB89D80|nr:hypothetical protein [Methylobacterium sp. E-025]MCJ2112240.1 hypothetical protein [Methylobacterium sp. E-025]